jgi:hypothetical protein
MDRMLLSCLRNIILSQKCKMLHVTWETNRLLCGIPAVLSPIRKLFHRSKPSPFDNVTHYVSHLDHAKHHATTAS